MFGEDRLCAQSGKRRYNEHDGKRAEERRGAHDEALRLPEERQPKQW
jgi:hypothetical protein